MSISFGVRETGLPSIFTSRRWGSIDSFPISMGVCDNRVVRDALLKRASTRKSSSFWLKGFVK